MCPISPPARFAPRNIRRFTNIPACAYVNIDRGAVASVLGPQQVKRKRRRTCAVIQSHWLIERLKQVHASQVRGSLPIEAQAILDIQSARMAGSDWRQLATA